MECPARFASQAVGTAGVRALPQAPVRIHVENNPEPEPALRFTPEHLERMLAALPRDRLSFTVNDDRERTAEIAADAEILFAVRKPNALAFAKRLRWIQSISAGVEGLLPLLPPGTMLTNASGVHREKGGEFILAAVLMLNYAIPRFATDKEQKRWAPRFESTVKGKRAMLLGVGAIGGEGARLLKLLGVTTIGVSRSGGRRQHVDRSITFAEIDGRLPEADFLVSSLPLTRETEGLIDRRRLNLLPSRAGVAIVGRAKVFDCDALLAKLKDETLGGAVLDVFPQEPAPPDSPFWTTPNLVMTPHCSVDDHAVYMDRCVEIFTDNLKRYLAGAPLRNVVDPERGY
jgi:phosphoglycerate dehydrogenase-like enzyme